MLNIHDPFATSEKALLGIVFLALEPLPVAYQLLDEGRRTGVAQIGAEEFAAVEPGDRVEAARIGDVFEAFAVYGRIILPFED